jgi:hypothetical protein
MDTERPRQRGLAQIAICGCLALAGCASQPDRLPIEAGDVCGGQRAELAKFQGYYGTVIAPGIERVSSTVGGVIGTVVDTFRPNAGGSGTAAGQRIGARAGAAVGRFGGYFLAKVANTTVSQFGSDRWQEYWLVRTLWWLMGGVRGMVKEGWVARDQLPSNSPGSPNHEPLPTLGFYIEKIQTA